MAPVYDYLLFNQRWVQWYVDRWLSETGIEYGPVFRSFRRDGVTLRPDAMTTRSIRAILQSYPIMNEQGEEQTFTPLDLRRTLARRLYLAGIDFEALLSNLGVSSSTLLEYIGLPQTLKSEADRQHEGQLQAGDEHALWNATPLLERLRTSERRY